jgi:tetratricopeptide (TPR) repeat protein
MSSDAAEALRRQGNDAFARHEYKKAAKIYRDALRLAPSAVLHCNRAMCFIKLQDWPRAVSDCVAGLAATPPQPLRIKLLYRLGVAHAAQHHWAAATKFLTQALELDPGNAAARAALEEAAAQAAVDETTATAAELPPPPPAAAAHRFTRIPVATVDKLPERFQALLEPRAPVPAASPAVEREISQMFASTPTGSSAAGAGASKTLPASTAAAPAAAGDAAETASMHYLTSLRSVPPARKQKAYELVVNIPPAEYREVFGPAGMDADFLPFFMEAAHQVALADTVPDWHTKILTLLAAFAAMPRYTVALVFCAQKDLSGLLATIKRKHPALLAAYESHLQASI